MAADSGIFRREDAYHRAVSDPLVTARPTICLNMIVRNEAHIVAEVLETVAPYITSWVIVDTGSQDGTQNLIRRQMAALAIPGELHDRPWHNFGHNRSEALSLAQGHGDYIWVIDADDLLRGTPDFGRLGADVYQLRHGADFTYWRRQLFRNGMGWHYKGVVHEYPDCVGRWTEARLDGDYYIESRRLGARSRDPQKYALDAELLLAEVQRNPEDARSVFYLAQSYYDFGDFAKARDWYARRAEMGGWDEEVYLAVFRLAQAMSQLDAHWPDVQHTYLRAFESRPTRAEPLHAIAHRYRSDKRYRLGYLFAERAAQIPLPDEDTLFVGGDVYAWRAADEQAVCASWIGKHAEAFTLWRRLLARPDIPEADRHRIAGNRDVCVPAMLKAATAYPDTVAQTRTDGPRNAEVTISLIAGAERHTTEQTLNSFLHCCPDLPPASRFLVLLSGLGAADRAHLQQRYPFLEFSELSEFNAAEPPESRLAQIRDLIGGRFWLHLGEGWRFFAPESLITRLTAVLHAEPDVFQVAINFTDADKLTGAVATEDAARRTAGAGRYVLTDQPARGPAMFDTTRPTRTTRPCTASLDEVLCIAAVAPGE
jgi:glycosyltransferase involved in cell wall biosynthesis